MRLEDTSLIRGGRKAVLVQRLVKPDWPIPDKVQAAACFKRLNLPILGTAIEPGGRHTRTEGLDSEC